MSWQHANLRFLDIWLPSSNHYLIVHFLKNVSMSGFLEEHDIETDNCYKQLCWLCVVLYYVSLQCFLQRYKIHYLLLLFIICWHVFKSYIVLCIITMLSIAIHNTLFFYFFRIGLGASHFQSQVIHSPLLSC